MYDLGHIDTPLKSLTTVSFFSSNDDDDGDDNALLPLK